MLLSSDVLVQLNQYTEYERTQKVKYSTETDYEKGWVMIMHG